MTSDPKTSIKGYPSFWWRSIGRRLILYIMLFSSVVTLVSTVVQLYFEYQRDMGYIESNWRHIEQSYVKSISAGLWSFNERMIKVQLEGILDLPDVKYLELSDNKELHLSTGRLPEGKSVERHFPLQYQHRDAVIELGTLRVVAGLDGVYQRLQQRVLTILLTQGIKTFLVSTFIFGLFYWLVGRHLRTMADYVRALRPEELDKPLTLHRFSRSVAEDEIGVVAGAINEMRENLRQDIARRQQTEDALRQSEARHRALLRALPDMMFLFDGDGVFLDFHAPEAVSLLKKPEEFLGRNIREVFPGKLAELTLTQIEKVRISGQGMLFEYRLKVDGAPHIYECRMVACGSNFLALVRDITEHRRVERDYRNLFREMLEGFALHEVICNSEGRPVDYRFLTVNPAFERMTGLTSGQIVGKTVLDVLPGTERGWIETFGQVALTGTPAQFENYAQELDRHFTVTAFQPQAGQFACIFTDITDRKKSEEALRLSREQFQLAVKGSSDGIWDWDLRTNAVFFSNRWKEQLGYCDDGLENTFSSFERLLHPEDKQRVLDYVKDYLESEAVQYSCEFRMRHKDGSYRWILARGEAVRDGQGHLYRMAGSHTDVTERKVAELALQKKNEELEHFVYTISHDLKSPLVTVNSFLGLLQQDVAAGNGEKILEDIHYIRNASDKMEQLLGALLQFSRIGRMENSPELFTLNELVAECLSVLAGPIQLKRIVVDVVDMPLQLYGDRLRLGQVWQNLIENAVKYIGDQAQPRIEIGVDHQGGEVVFYVSDNGPGIAPEHAERIFGLFAQLDPCSEGCGLGLALVKKIVEHAGGRIWVEPKGAGEGSCFRFTLPAAISEKGRI